MSERRARLYSKKHYDRRMLTYEELKINPRRFLSLTGLTPEEFEDLLPAYQRAYQKKYAASKTIAGKARKRQAGGGRKGSLEGIEQKLLFALVYQKGYPLQAIQGELFGSVKGGTMNGSIVFCRSCNKPWKIWAFCWKETRRSSRRKRKIGKIPPLRSLMEPKGVARDRKRLKNRLCITVARRKCIATRI